MRGITVLLLAAVSLGLLIVPSAFADEDCGADVRLDDVGGSMENVPPLDQKAMPICYAFSAAELLQTSRCSHGSEDCATKLVSPVSIAVNAELFEVNHGTSKASGSFSDSEAFWGYRRDQIQAADLFQGPYCDQNAITPLDRESDLSTYIDEMFARYKKNCVQAVSFFGSANQDPIGQASCRMMDGQPLDHQGFEAFAAGAQKCLMQSGLPVNVKQVETALVTSNPLLLVQGEIQDTCKQNAVAVPEMPPLDFYSIRPAHASEFEADADRMSKAKQAIAAEFDKLGHKGQPVFVTYCADVLFSGRGFIPSYGSDCSGAHASLIIGRRKNPNAPHSCQYLVRNSWGKTCNRASNSRYHYHSDWDCDQDKGDYWIDQDSLMNATLEVGGAEGEGIGGLIPPSYMSSHTPTSLH